MAYEHLLRESDEQAPGVTASGIHACDCNKSGLANLVSRRCVRFAASVWSEAFTPDQRPAKSGRRIKHGSGSSRGQTLVHIRLKCLTGRGLKNRTAPVHMRTPDEHATLIAAPPLVQVYA
jgi:hypothetical protein